MGYGFMPKLKLIYRVSDHVDGEKASKFWNMCKDKGPTLTIIKSDKNKKFGGFRTKPFK